MWEHMSASVREVFRDTMNNTPKGKIQKSADGEYVFEAGCTLRYTDDSRNNPKVRRIVHFYLDDGTEADAAMRLWYRVEREQIDYERMREAVEGICGEECTVVYNNGDFR